MAAADLKLAAPLASAFFPIGPAATDTFPPSVTLPASENVLTALLSFKIITKSVNSAPICPPNPTLDIVRDKSTRIPDLTYPAVPNAEGADHAVKSQNLTSKEAWHLRESNLHPSGSLATTSPEPTLADTKKPPFTTVKIANLHPLRSVHPIRIVLKGSSASGRNCTIPLHSQKC